MLSGRHFLRLQRALLIIPVNKPANATFRPFSASLLLHPTQRLRPGLEPLCFCSFISFLCYCGCWRQFQTEVGEVKRGRIVFVLPHIFFLNIMQLETFSREEPCLLSLYPLFLTLRPTLRGRSIMWEDYNHWNALLGVKVPLGRWAVNQTAPADEPRALALEPVALGQEGSTVLLSSFPLCPQLGPT